MTSLEKQRLFSISQGSNDRGNHLVGIEEEKRAGCRSAGNSRFYYDIFGWQGGRGLGSMSHREVAHRHP